MFPEKPAFKKHNKIKRVISLHLMSFHSLSSFLSRRKKVDGEKLRSRRLTKERGVVQARFRVACSSSQQAKLNQAKTYSLPCSGVASID